MGVGGCSKLEGVRGKIPVGALRCEAKDGWLGMILWFVLHSNVEKERSLNVIVASAFAGKMSGLCADPVHKG